MKETIHVRNEKQLEQAYGIRKQVFVEEQGVPQEVEIDAYDSEAEHVLVLVDHEPAGTGRIRIVEDTAKIERVCVLPAYRKSGIGREIMEGLERLAADKGLTKSKLHAQTHAERFYSRLGYETVSDIFMEEGIPHVLMQKKLGKKLEAAQ
ncbi:GNAT family N-acetyltransferase [Paenibacillus tarimensis]